MTVAAWWRSRGRAARLDLYLRGTLYATFAAAVPLAAGSVPGRAALWVAAAVATVHTVLSVLLVRAGVDHYLGNRPFPARLVAAGGALTAAGVAAAVLVYPDAAPGQPDGPANAVLLILVVSYVAALSTAVRPVVALAVGGLGSLALYALAAGQGAARPGAPALAMVIVTGFVVASFRVTVWMLGALWELDRSREVQAKLAVAEERLRFARDLHDVVGRTLSVVAVKAELAAQLAKRGRDEAVDEMLEVRRIAQESLAELRAVVGGYRTADLDAELAGARSLLTSAGIACRVIGDGGGLSAAVQGTLGWAVREGATNVLRHSEARHCTVALRLSTDGTVTLTVDNDGAAAGDARVRFGSGLIGLAERIAGMGGTLTAEREPPEGFRLTAQLPMAAEEATA
ncbi:two-component system, NarL family, sensor histidine kinase DesK [Actinoplanes sp. SE50]|uniref:sensor histidine kinase n=1 Tax=unclassified Actinoplanes TaxID=2626549 RepID=UPI00023EC7C8|nr:MULTISPECIES: sensor histidine kinase [unclassified Actinoplanes]AEV84712.1 two-component system, NarL family, sensor histidine kinase DesK [Actinoplanes sp. SE50/110]ATO83104.1 two-component system, NarL family, sensor histidine kinase DesK [Actinoplanes sp. SE50]SLM00511.1 two-component system sensor histidine kinase [Actinoplanes sp. SE50/110]